MTIRRYISGEEAAVWEVVFQATRVSNARDYHPDLIERWAPRDKDMDEWAERLKETNPFVAIVEDRVVGMAEIESNGFIDYFYVHPDYQARGIGTALMTKILSVAVELGAHDVHAYVSVTAEPFFTAQGFEITEAKSNVVIGHPAPNFAMRRNLG